MRQTHALHGSSVSKGIASKVLAKYLKMPFKETGFCVHFKIPE